MRLVFHQGVANHIQLIVKTYGIDFMSHLPERRDDIVFSLDLKLLFVTQSIE